MFPFELSARVAIKTLRAQSNHSQGPTDQDSCKRKKNLAALDEEKLILKFLNKLARLKAMLVQNYSSPLLF